MKNLIKYYYGLDVSRIRQVNKVFYLEIAGFDYLFCPCLFDASLPYYLLSNLPFHTVVNTLDNKPNVMYENISYTLFKINVINRKITEYDIYESDIFVINNINIGKKWSDMWSKRVDYIDYQMHELELRYPVLNMVYSYYIGLTENAIQLLNELSIQVRPSFAHPRINYDTNLIELYNPANLIIDTRARDLSEYYKNEFFQTDITYINLEKIILNTIESLDNNERLMFFIRMLYPSYFFDVYDDILLGKKEEDEIEKITSKVGDYESLIKRLYFEIKKTIYIPNIDWLN